MKCNRLISLIKNWYLKVQEESMAPARMVAFMEKHISQCEECLADPDVKQEAAKIREIVLPPSKIPKPKAVRVSKDAEADEEEVEEEIEGEASEDGEEAEDSESDDEDEGDDDDDDYDPDLIDDDEEI